MSKKINFTDKTPYVGTDPENAPIESKFLASDANEIKNAVNENADLLDETKQTADNALTSDDKTELENSIQKKADQSSLDATDRNLNSIQSKVQTIEDDYLTSADKTELESQFVWKEKTVIVSITPQNPTLQIFPADGVVRDLDKFYITRNGGYSFTLIDGLKIRLDQFPEFVWNGGTTAVNQKSKLIVKNTNSSQFVNQTSSSPINVTISDYGTILPNFLLTVVYREKK